WGGQMVVHPLATQCRGDTSGREGVAAVLTFVVDHPRPETIECGRNAPDAQSLSEITPEHESGLVLGCGQWLRPHQGQQAFGFEYLGRQHVAVLVLVDGEPGVDGVDPVDRLLPPRAAVPVTEPDPETAHRGDVTNVWATHRRAAPVAVGDLVDSGARSLPQDNQRVGLCVQQRDGGQPGTMDRALSK